jgi:hypothetical protein
VWTQRVVVTEDGHPQVLRVGRPVHTLVDLTMTPQHGRGHGALYDGLNHRRIDIKRLQATLAGLPLSQASDGSILLPVDEDPAAGGDVDPTTAAI